MRILFTTRHEDSVSTVLNLENFRRLGEVEGVEFQAYGTDYENHDVVLFMGYDPDVEGARRVHPNIKIGVVDVRPLGLDCLKGTDFLVSNGPEMTAMAARYVNNVFEYPIYPEVTPRERAPEGNDRLVVCYHGNRPHAVAMFPHVSMALEELGREIPLELRLIYNVEKSSLIPEKYLPKAPVRVKTVQWHPAVYEQELAEADIGIVPNLTPMHRVDEAKRLTEPRDRAFGAHETEVLARFKPTSNPGRLLAFAQHGIPVVADMFPSAAQIVRNGETGFLVNDAASWYQALRRLALNPELRATMGEALKGFYRDHYRICDVNQKFVRFLDSLAPRHEAPAALEGAGSAFDAKDSAPPMWSTLAMAARNALGRSRGND